VKLKILKVPNPILRQPCSRHEGSYQEIAQDLIDAMKDIGLGLAAPQLGILTRVAVVQISGKKEPLVLVNPEIMNRYGQSLATEACLSLPGKQFEIMRSAVIFVRSEAWTGTRRFSGLTARAIQHELDHFQGLLLDEKVMETSCELPKNA
jgi:peptide deformylase